MKILKTKFILLVILMSQSIFAQSFDEVKGMYTQESIGGIYIYNDETFALYGYATLVFGKYKIENEEIAFTPDIPEQVFSIIGRKNMKINQGANFTFGSNFLQEGPTFIKIDEEKFQPIFDENFVDGSSYYNFDFAKKPNKLSFGLATQNHKHNFNTNSFSLDNDYNEFLVINRPTISEQKPFKGKIILENGLKALVCTWGTFYKTEKEEKDDKEMIRFLDQYKKEFRKDIDVKVFYFNDQFKPANGYNHLSEQENIFDINNYILDERSNKYIHKSIYQKGKNYIDAVAEEYHDENIMLEYHLVELDDITNISYNEIEINKNSLFPSNAPEKSKEEKEFKETVEKKREEIPLDERIEPTYIKPIPVSAKGKKKKEK